MNRSVDAGSQDARTPVAIISNAQTPYRLSLHQRIVREVPEIELWSLFTHEVSNAPWRLESPAEIRPVYFGQGEDSGSQSRWSGQWGEWIKARRILRWIAERRVRFVVLLGYNDLGRVRILKSCQRRQIPCFLFGDSNVLADRLHGWRAWFKRVLVSHLVKAASGVFYCGSLGRAYFRKYGASDDQMFPFPYEPDYSAFENVSLAAVDAVRRQYGLVEGRRYLIYSGRLVAVKRVDLLIEAFSRIAEQRSEWSVIIAGDGALRQALQSTIPTPLADRFIWTGFVDDRATLASLYKCADALVLPSDVEPWGVVVTEAAASSLALVCSAAVGAAAEVVRDGVNGRVFAAGNVTALTEALLDVTDRDHIEKMKAASPSVLADWRRRGDPVKGLRAALRFAGVLAIEEHGNSH